MSQKQVMPKSEDLSRSLEINAIWTFDTEFPTIFNKSCTYITFKSAVKHRQLGYGYPRGQIVHLAEATRCFIDPKTRKIYFLDPPPQKKRLKDTNCRDMSTRTSVFLYNQPVTWIFTRSRLSNLSDSDYKVIPSLKIII